MSADPTDEEIEAAAKWWWTHGMWSPRPPSGDWEASRGASGEEMKNRARDFARQILTASRSAVETGTS